MKKNRKRNKREDQFAVKIHEDISQRASIEVTSDTGKTCVNEATPNNEEKFDLENKYTSMHKNTNVEDKLLKTVFSSQYSQTNINNDNITSTKKTTSSSSQTEYSNEFLKNKVPIIPGFFTSDSDSDEGTEKVAGNKRIIMGKFLKEYERFKETFYLREDDEESSIHSIICKLIDELYNQNILENNDGNRVVLNIFSIFFELVHLIEKQEKQIKKMKDENLDFLHKQLDLKQDNNKSEYGRELEVKKNQLTPPNEINNEIKETYAQKLKKSLNNIGDIKSAEDKSFSIVVNDLERVNDIKGIISKKIGTQSDINLTKTYVREKNIKFFCRSDKEITSLKNLIENTEEIKNKIFITRPQNKKMIHPRIIIRNVPQEISKENLVNTIKEQNYNLLEDSDAIFPIFNKKNKDNSNNWICVTKPATCKKLITKGKILINLSCCQVYIFQVITRCFRCFDLFHTKNHCNSNERCSKCGKEHNYKECKEIKPNCMNCLNYNIRFKTNFDTVHSCLSNKCPSYKANQKFLLSKIDFGI